MFGSVSKRGIRSIVSAATEIDVRAGRTLVQQGGSDRDLFVIMSGTAEVTKDGKRIATLRPGDFFGEMALLHKAPRMATVTARTDMALMVLGAREFQVVVEREPAIARRLLEAMAQRVRSTERGAISH